MLHKRTHTHTYSHKSYIHRWTCRLKKKWHSNNSVCTYYPLIYGDFVLRKKKTKKQTNSKQLAPTPSPIPESYTRGRYETRFKLQSLGKVQLFFLFQFWLQTSMKGLVSGIWAKLLLIKWASHKLKNWIIVILTRRKKPISYEKFFFFFNADRLF